MGNQRGCAFGGELDLDGRTHSHWICRSFLSVNA